MKTLFANGCSWTFGGGLTEKYDQYHLLNHITWPAHLKSLMNFDNHVNLSAGCGSNQRIFRTTLDWLLAQTPETLSNTTAVIQWTELSRYEYYVPTGNNPNKNDYFDWENIQERWASVKAGVVLSFAERFENYDNYVFPRSQDRLTMYSDIEGLYRFISEAMALANIFKQFNVKYYYWNFNTSFETCPEPHKSFFLQNCNWLEPSGQHNFVYDRISVKDSHPNESGHMQLAQAIYQSINDLKYYD